MTPRDVFTRFQESVLTGSFSYFDDMAEDVVVEWPFNPPGQPRQIEGRAEMLAMAKAGRAALTVRFDEFRNVVVHETTDPEVIIAEYEIVGTNTTTGQSVAAGFVQVIRVRDGKMAHVREYQDVAAMTAAMA